MDSNLKIIKALTVALLSELDSLIPEKEDYAEKNNFNFNKKVKEFEVKLIKTALLKTSGNQRRAAKLLGLATSTLNNKIKVYHIHYLKSDSKEV
jgi:DNA-binding NtrC family response regulator